MGLSMSFFMFMYLCFLLFFFQFTSSSRQPLCHDDERFALLRFKESFVINCTYASGDPSAYPKAASWNLKGNSDCCSWDGVKCNEDTGYVIKLDLTSSCLYGFLNSTGNSLFSLVHLQWLSLADNHFNHSDIPYEIKSLSKLSHLNLSLSVFSGAILFSMSNLINLTYLDLNRNSFQGAIPTSISNLTNLIYLDLSWNGFQGTILSSIINLTNLNHLDLSANHLGGAIPTSISNLTNLIYLDLSWNGFQGAIPTSISNLTNLIYLDLSWNGFQGTILSSIINLTNLNHLDLSANHLGGVIPSSMSDLTNLTYLGLYSNRFQGTIPSFFGNLTKLVHLDISYNDFWNELPISIGNLDALQLLDVRRCHFSGEIPSSLSNLTQLSYLDLSHNKILVQNSYSWSWITKLTKLTDLGLGGLNLSGEIPFSFMNLTQMISLDLASNQLQGPIPNSIFELKNLEYLNLYSNRLNGTVELDIYLLKLKSLSRLVLSSNNLSVLTDVNSTVQKFYTIGFGSCNLTDFPKFLQNQDELFGLDLSSNNIRGQIPGWLLNIHGLISLNLSNNLLTGFDHHHVVLPWKRLQNLDLRFNKLQGSLPAPSLSILFYLASNNSLSGEIPPWICSLNQLQALDLSYNSFSGMLPGCLGNFSYDLSLLGLQGNNFYGSIPESFIIGSGLRMIDLSRNNLEGKIPRSLSNCTSLEFLNLGYNQITDTFPSWLGILLELKILILKSNKFHGVIMELETNCEFSKLHVIDLSDNMFTGELPSKYFQSWTSMKIVNESQLTYMEDSLQPSRYLNAAFFDFLSYAYAFVMNNKGIEIAYGKVSNKLISINLSRNRFTGKIPTSISDLRALKNLNLSNNNFFGSIPSSLGSLTEIESLDLSNNKLSGEIPQQLATLTFLAVFKVSHNILTGSIPQGPQFTTFDKTSFEGNPGLCGKPLSKRCENYEGLEREEDQDRGSESIYAFDWKIVLIGFAGGLIVGMVLGNEFCYKVLEWFETIFQRQLKTVKRNKGRRN